MKRIICISASVVAAAAILLISPVVAQEKADIDAIMDASKRPSEQTSPGMAEEPTKENLFRCIQENGWDAVRSGSKSAAGWRSGMKFALAVLEHEYGVRFRHERLPNETDSQLMAAESALNTIIYGIGDYYEDPSTHRPITYWVDRARSENKGHPEIFDMLKPFFHDFNDYKDARRRERLASEQRKEAAEMKARAEHETAEKRVVEARAQDEAAQRAAFIEEVRKGSRTIETCDEAIVFYASDGALIGRPKAIPDQHSYTVLGGLQKHTDDSDWIVRARTSYAIIRVGPQTQFELPDAFRVGDVMCAVGHYVKNIELPLTDGSSTIAPVIEAVFVGPQ